ncbi:hypothetical protein T05_1261 [Trichinella murrelli]|uniref:Uncharacterized protein n=1 Tax=Trichinella murrelli TaxID=144512 RepID=A0A0V0T327_9BILA|nr:hypothetical protein T05_1261 [Trichinella murrelli]
MLSNDYIAMKHGRDWYRDKGMLTQFIACVLYSIGLVPLGLNSIPIRAHCSFIGRCPRYFIRP